MAGANFHQYIPDSVLISRPVDEVQSLVESSKSGPSPKGFPLIDLCLTKESNIPPNLKLISNIDNKLFI